MCFLREIKMKEEDRHSTENYHSDEERASDESEPKLREISEQELKQIIEKHKKWLESNGNDGEKANLSATNLQKIKIGNEDLQSAILNKANFNGAYLRKTIFMEANLEKATLKEAYLRKAILMKANLRESIFQNANLRRAKLQKADLGKADFRQSNLERACLKNANLHRTVLYGASLVKADISGADLDRADLQKADLTGIKGMSNAKLKYTDFTEAKGLMGTEFATMDITGCKLPKNLIEFKALEIVKETSQNARKVFFAMLLGCVYSWLTIATTTDVRLLTNTASSPLPIIGTEIPIAGFYIVAPLVLICLYFYFHLYLIKLWEALSGLPAIFHDGKRLDEIAYPWLLNGLVRRHFKLLKTDRPFIAHVQEWITIMLAWWVVPITMIAFWLRYIRLHDWRGTSFHIGLIVVSFSFAIIFYRLCALTLKSKKSQIFRLKDFLKDKRFYYGVIVVLVGFFFILLSYGTIEGVRTKEHYFSDIKKFVPWAFEKLGYGVFVNFREQRVTEIPPNIGAISKGERLEFVKGANLKGRNLIYADLSEAFMVKADLRRASLNYAILKNTNLQQADLRETDLQEADLGNANLKQANLSGAKLQQTNLGESELQNCIFERANLQQADLRSANLMDAYLWDANLKQAKFGNAILQNTEFVRANLQEVNLWNANLEQADLRNVNLKDAYLWGALFINANLTGANNLTIEQVSKVKTLYQTKLDPDLLEQVKKCCPHLLEEPKKESEQTK